MGRDEVVTVSIDELARMSESVSPAMPVASRVRTVLAEIAIRGMPIKGVLADREYLMRTYSRRIQSAKADRRHLPEGTAELLDALSHIEDAQVFALFVDDKDWAADLFVPQIAKRCWAVSWAGSRVSDRGRPGRATIGASSVIPAPSPGPQYAGMPSDR
jgi:hypothetical protein